MIFPSSLSRLLSYELKKWMATISLSITQRLAYKVNFFLLFLGPMLVFFLVQYNLWHSLFLFREGAPIGGYTRDEMIAYQGWVLVTALLTQGFHSRDLAQDIRLGRISSYLIYPFDFWQYHLGTFLGLQCIQLCIATTAVAALFFTGVFQELSATHLFLGVSVALCAGLLWYLIQYALGLFAFWIEQTWTLRVLFALIASFCSGAIFPLELLPEWAREIVLLSPFPYLTYVPVKTFLGAELDLPLPAPVALTFWSIVVWGCGKLLWNRGMRMYTAAGM
ncbi:ABC-2 family transporter protein [bacterium]|nr:ABC-2 family transporter protein [bacterium]